MYCGENITWVLTGKMWKKTGRWRNSIETVWKLRCKVHLSESVVRSGDHSHNQEESQNLPKPLVTSGKEKGEKGPKRVRRRVLKTHFIILNTTSAQNCVKHIQEAQTTLRQEQKKNWYNTPFILTIVSGYKENKTRQNERDQRKRCQVNMSTSQGPPVAPSHPKVSRDPEPIAMWTP